MIEKDLVKTISRKLNVWALSNNYIKFKLFYVIVIAMWKFMHFILVKLLNVWDKYKKSIFYLQIKRFMHNFSSG